MLKKRIQMGPHQELQSKVWMCFFGMHVHTATIIIGCWHLFWNILALAIPTIIIQNDDSFKNIQNIYETNVDMSAPALPTPLSKINPAFSLGGSIQYKTIIHHNSMVSLCMVSITLTMLYGAIKGKPLHLLPFFCLQVLDFAVAALMPDSYGRQSHATQLLLSKSEPSSINSMMPSDNKIYIAILLIFVTVVGLKAYAIVIVWRCHKYLTLRQQCMRSILPLGLAELAVNAGGRAYSNMLPNYEEAVAQYLKQAPPPSYQVAMSNVINEQQPELQLQPQPFNNNISDVEMATSSAEVVNQLNRVEEANNSKLSTELAGKEGEDIAVVVDHSEQYSSSATKQNNSTV